MQNIFLIGDEICWECASGFHWDTGSNDCEPDCGVSGDTCTGFIQDECCVAQNLYCSQFGRGGEPITPGQYHCCLEGDYWDVGLGQCRNEELCYNPGVECGYLSDFPFNPPGAWWNDAECLYDNQALDKACCFTTLFNPSCSDPRTHYATTT